MIDYPFKWNEREKIRLARTLFHINGTNELTNFVEFLEAELIRLDQVNRKEPDKIILRQRQGACQVLANLIVLLRGASEMHDTLKKNENMM